MYVHKQASGGESWKVSSNNVCNNLVSKTTPFISGQSGGNYYCTVYSQSGCSGSSLTVNGRVKFPWNARSMRCSC